MSRVRIGALLVALVSVAVGGCSESGNPPAESVTVADAPDYPLFDHTLTWGDGDVYVIGGAGGDMNDGLLVDDPLAWNQTDGVRSIASPPGPARNSHTAVWTGSELFIWSGSTVPYGDGDGLLNSTALYDPATDTWRRVADSPPEIGRSRGRGATFDGYVIVTGGTTPSSDNQGTIGVYNLAADTWQVTRMPGTTLTVTATDNAVYILWADAADALVLSWFDPLALSRHDLDLPALPEGANRSTVVAVENRLVLWAEAQGAGFETGEPTDSGDAVKVLVLDDDGAVAADPNRRIAWRQLDVDVDYPGSVHGFSEVRPLVHTDEWLAFSESVDLRWVRISDGLQVDRSLTTPQSCAIRTEAVGTPIGVVAWGGLCSRVNEDGSEEQLVGHFVFTPPVVEGEPDG